MAEGSIHYKLDLIVLLLDTTTGLPIHQKEVLFQNGSHILPMLERDQGTYIIFNHGRTDMELEITVKGYMKEFVSVSYERLSKEYPTVEIPMIPMVPTYGYHDMCEVEGYMPGIEEIAAISLGEMDAKLGAYNAKKGTLRLFSTRRLDESCYAILHKEDMKFEEFSIVKKSEKGLLLYLKEPLLQECKPEEGIARIVRGKIDANGRYVLRVRKDGKGTEYLVRYTVKGITKYQHMFLNNDEERRLE